MIVNINLKFETSDKCKTRVDLTLDWKKWDKMIKKITILFFVHIIKTTLLICIVYIPNNVCKPKNINALNSYIIYICNVIQYIICISFT